MLASLASLIFVCGAKAITELDGFWRTSDNPRSVRAPLELTTLPPFKVGFISDRPSTTRIIIHPDGQHALAAIYLTPAQFREIELDLSEEPGKYNDQDVGPVDVISSDESDAAKWSLKCITGNASFTMTQIWSVFKSSPNKLYYDLHVVNNASGAKASATRTLTRATSSHVRLPRRATTPQQFTNKYASKNFEAHTIGHSYELDVDAPNYGHALNSAMAAHRKTGESNVVTQSPASTPSSPVEFNLPIAESYGKALTSAMSLGTGKDWVSSLNSSDWVTRYIDRLAGGPRAYNSGQQSLWLEDYVAKIL